MAKETASLPETVSAEDALRGRLLPHTPIAHGIEPVLRNLLARPGSGLFREETVARVRGMLRSIADSLSSLASDEGTGTGAATDDLVSALIAREGILAHIHAVALEWRMARRLQSSLSVDPVAPRIVEAALAGGARDAARSFLIAQDAAFRSHGNMRLPLDGLCGDAFHAALDALHEVTGTTRRTLQETELRLRYSEAQTRLGRAASLLMSMDGGPVSALLMEKAGTTLFASALSILTGQPRESVMIALYAADDPQLALMLRAAGLESRQIEQQLVTIHPGTTPPLAALELDSAAAAAMLDEARGPK